MTKQKDLFIFQNRFQELAPLTGVDFVMKLTGNFQIIKAEIEKVKAVKEPSPELKAYHEAAAKLYKEYAVKDKSGAEKTEVVQGPEGPIGKYVMDLARESEFNEKLTKLRADNKKVIDEADKRDKDFAEALERTVDLKKLKFELITKADLPKDITAGHLQLLASVGMVQF